MLLRISSSMITAEAFDVGERFHRSGLERINGNNHLFSRHTSYAGYSGQRPRRDESGGRMIVNGILGTTVFTVG